jgi:hypothetical protein
MLFFFARLIRYKNGSTRGVRPRGWTGSRGGFDPLPGVVILELREAQIAERGVPPLLR